MRVDGLDGHQNEPSIKSGRAGTAALRSLDPSTETAALRSLDPSVGTDYAPTPADPSMGWKPDPSTRGRDPSSRASGEMNMVQGSSGHGKEDSGSKLRFNAEGKCIGW